MDVLTANYSFLNERLADNYGIEGVKGPGFRRVTFPAGSPRGGILGMHLTILDKLGVPTDKLGNSTAALKLDRLSV